MTRFYHKSISARAQNCRTNSIPAHKIPKPKADALGFVVFRRREGFEEVEVD